MVIGYGLSEFGTMTMFNFGIPDRTNESGILIPFVKAKIVDPISHSEVNEGERGELYINTPAVMLGYLNNKEATEAFFVDDESGEKWARTGDIASVQYRYNGKPVYEVSGRSSDSFIDENGETVYLFDIENEIEVVEGVKEAEVIALTIEGKKCPIAHMILDAETNQDDVIREVDLRLKSSFKNPHAIPYAYKIRQSFSTSPISGKRDYAILQYDTEGFLKVNEEGTINSCDIESSESRVQNDLLYSNIK